jgi:transposase
MPEARYVRSLSQAEEKALRELYRQTQNADIRTRCQMILLSAQEHAVSEIAELTFFNEDSVLYWLDRYESQGLSGLEDRPRSGRPPKSEWPMGS